MTITIAKTLMVHPLLENFKRPTPHSIFSPSAGDRWMSCPYSIDATKGIPEETSKYAEEGTLAHSVCEAVFRKNQFDIPFPPELSIQMIGYDDVEMMECAEGYSQVVSHWLSNQAIIGTVLSFGLERGIPIFPEEGCFGTADCLIIGTNAAVVIDYKHGKGKNVSANTLQLKVYAAGVARFLTNVPEGYKIYAVVYQPRTDQAPKETSYTMPELNQCLGDIWNAINKSKEAGLEPVEGSHCFWCPANRTKDLNFKCKAIKEKPLKLAQENFGKFLADMNTPVVKITDPNPLRDQAIIKIMALYPMMKRIAESGAEEFMMRMQDGEAIDGVRMIDDIGNRTINAENDADAAKIILEKFPKVNPYKIIPEAKKLRTLTDIEKEIGKNKLDSICVRKVKKRVDILDGKIRDILGEMEAYSRMITNSSEEDV